MKRCERPTEEKEKVADLLRRFDRNEEWVREQEMTFKWLWQEQGERS